MQRSPEEELTRREKIMRLLEESDHFMTVDELAYILEIKGKERRIIYEDLIHIAKSVRAISQGRKMLIMQPPRCRKCGFVFTGFKKPSKPGRCPKCYSTWIEPPKFKIVEKKR